MAADSDRDTTDTAGFPRRPTGEALRLGLKGRCPRCGAGRLFTGYLKVADACDVCGLGFAGHDSGDAAAVPAILVLGGLLVGAALYVEFTYAPSPWVHVALWLPAASLMTLWVLPKIKGIGIALQHQVRSTEEDTPLGGT